MLFGGIFAVLIGVSYATVITPISWFPSFLSVDVAATLHDGSRVRRSIDIHLGYGAVGWINTNIFRFDQNTDLLDLFSMDNLSVPDSSSVGEFFLGTLNLNPDSPHTLSLGSFIISPREFVVGLYYPQSYCPDGSEFTELVCSNDFLGLWGARIANTGQRVVFDTGATIAITAADHARFLDQIREINAEYGIALQTDSDDPYGWVDNCDIDQIDNVWPILSFSLDTIHGHSIDVEFTPRDYIKIATVDDDSGILQQRCYIDVWKSSHFYRTTYVLGQTFFRKYAVYFEQVDSPRVGVCIESTY